MKAAFLAALLLATPLWAAPSRADIEGADQSALDHAMQALLDDSNSEALQDCAALAAAGNLAAQMFLREVEPIS